MSSSANPTEKLNTSTMPFDRSLPPGPGNYHGVYFIKASHKFGCKISGKLGSWIGSFNDEESAALAYDKRMRELQREGPLNFPDQSIISTALPTVTSEVDAIEETNSLPMAEDSMKISSCGKKALPVTPQSNYRDVSLPYMTAPSRPVRITDSKNSNSINIGIPGETQFQQTNIVTGGEVEDIDEALTPRVQGKPESGEHSVLFPNIEAKIHFKEIIRGAFERGFGVDTTLSGVAQELEIRGYALPPTDLGEEGEDSALLSAISEEVLQVWIAKQADRSSADSPLEYCHSSKFGKIDGCAPKAGGPPISAPPKRKASPYMLFCNAKRKNLPTGLTVPERGRLLGEMWRNLDERTKDKFKAKAKSIKGGGNADHPTISSDEEGEVSHDSVKQKENIQDNEKLNEINDESKSFDEDQEDMEEDKKIETKEKTIKKYNLNEKENNRVLENVQKSSKSHGRIDDGNCGDLDGEVGSEVGKKRGRPPKETNDKHIEATKSFEGPTPRAKHDFDENDLEDDEDLPPEWHALPQDIKAKEMEVVWARYNAKHAAWPALVYNPSGVAEPLRSNALKCCTKKHLVYFYGSNEWSFISFNSVKPFGNSAIDGEMAPTAAQFKLFGLRKKKMYEKGVRMAKKDAKLKDKWQRAEWLCS